MKKIFLALTLCALLLFSAASATQAFPLPPEAPNDVGVNLALVGRYTLDGWGRLNNLAAQGDYLYLAAEKYLVILNVANPTQPEISARLNIRNGEVEKLDVNGDYAYVSVYTLSPFGGYTYMICRVDIHDPALPVVQGCIDGGYGTFISSGNFVYELSGFGVHVIDFSDPNTPQEIGYVETSTFYLVPGALAISGSYLYAVGPYELAIVDISNPALPQRLSLEMLFQSSGEMAISGDYAYVADSNGVAIVDISNPASPSRIATVSENNLDEITINGNHLYVRTSGEGEAIKIYSLSNPEAPVLVGQYPSTSALKHIALSGNYAYLLEENVGINVLDVSNPASPQPAGTIPSSYSRAVDVKPIGDLTYVTLLKNGVVGTLAIFDTSNPAQPVLVNDTGITGTYFLDNAGDYLYLSAIHGMPGVYHRATNIVDIADRLHPVLVGSYVYNFGPYYDDELAVSGAYTLGCSNVIVPQVHAGALDIIDFSDPTSPSYAKQYPIAGLCGAIKISGSYAYVGNFADTGTSGNHGLEILDITEPINPTNVADYIVDGGGVTAVVLVDHYAYLQPRNSLPEPLDVQIVDISDPTQPFLAGTADISIANWTILAPDQLAYSYTDTELTLINISDPLHPLVAGTYMIDPAATHTPQTANPQAGEDTLYMAAGENGLLVLQHTATLIAGQVTHPNGQPVSGVQISAGSGLTAATGADGGYTISGLKTGAYQITPTMTGGAFWPPVRQVIVPSLEQSEQDFTLLPLPVSTTLVSGSITTTLAYTDLQGLVTSLTFPPYTFPYPVSLVLTPSLPLDKFTGLDRVFTGHAFELQVYPLGQAPAGPQFTNPITTPITATVSIDYLDLDLGGVTDEQLLTLHWWDGSAWVEAATTCSPASTPVIDSTGNRLVMPVCRSGLFTLLGPTNTIFLPLITR